MASLVVRLDPAHTPLEALARFADLPYVCLLHSAAPAHPLSRFSFLTAEPVSTICAGADEWPAVCATVRSTIAKSETSAVEGPPFQGGWIGWLSYELGTAFDDITRHDTQPLPVADVSLGLYDWVIAWDHARGESWLISTGIDAGGQRDEGRAVRRAERVRARWSDARQAPQHGTGGSAATVSADFERPAYEAAVASVVEHILDGDIFQANLAQRFTAPFAGDAVSLYRALTEHSPAPMAAFVRHGDATIISASPEQFLHLDRATRRIETRPIKGTRPRNADVARDATLAAELLASEKDRAENVMIVDLLRNDLSRVCIAGSVHVPALCALESHPTVHHLVSVVAGRLAPGADALDLIARTFPGGSITGAPKLRAMEIIRALEPVARGVYSGSIVCIGLDGSMNSSIAIRTITITQDTASFHAGGGVTALSVAASEYDESLDKARAAIAALSMAP